MSDNRNSTSYVFADISELMNWSDKISTINEDAIKNLELLVQTISGLEDYWVGNCASGFIEDSTALVTNVKKCHNDMKSIPTGLIEVANVMSNQ